MEEAGDELTGEAASKAPPVTNLYSGFMHYVSFALGFWSKSRSCCRMGG